CCCWVLTCMDEARGCLDDRIILAVNPNGWERGQEPFSGLELLGYPGVGDNRVVGSLGIRFWAYLDTLV
ncbi:MAG: hypothetical protein WBE26_20255, partial [Phycisphaerae bacterium]